MNIANINLGGIIFFIVTGILIFLLDKKYIFIPIVLSVCYITYGQNIIIGGFNFYPVRIIFFLSWIRIIIRREFNIPIVNIIDKSVFYWLISSIILYSILWGFEYDAIKTKIGLLYDVLMMYGLFRIIINNYSDIEVIFKITAVLIFPMALLMLYERKTGSNLYSYFGGISAMSEIREGRIRCSGPFRHSILAGTFGAILIPLFIALYFSKVSYRNISYMGIISSLIIVYTSSSSGPLMALLMSIIGFMFWYMRDKMRTVRWILLGSIIMLHIIMKAPVWYTMARVSDLTGGGGWHRSFLINQAIVYINEWWLLGTKNTSHWFPYTLAINPDSADIVNQYIANGVDAGLLTMILFIFIIVRCFQGLGRAQTIEVPDPLGKRFCIWAIGVSLFAHVVSFFSVSYFDQINVYWYLLIAIISAIVNIHETGYSNNKFQYAN